MENKFGDFLQISSLYETIDIKEENVSDLIELLKGNVKLSVYCKECRQERVFRMQPLEDYFSGSLNSKEPFIRDSLGNRLSGLMEMCARYRSNDIGESSDTWKCLNHYCHDQTRLMNLEFVCSMDEKHHLDFTVLVTDFSVMKIGQYPSIADMTLHELNDYKKVISEEDRKELGTAIGLFAHGVGAGAYVYLRRIIERLVQQAAEYAKEKIDIDAFNNAKVEEKIKMLNGFVPDILIQNTMIYGILSKGIHELSEEECRQYFPIVKSCIFQILGMWENIRKKRAEEEKLKKALNEISGNIK